MTQVLQIYWNQAWSILKEWWPLVVAPILSAIATLVIRFLDVLDYV